MGAVVRPSGPAELLLLLEHAVRRKLRTRSSAGRKPAARDTACRARP